MNEFESWLFNALFLQKVRDVSAALSMAHLYTAAGPEEPADVVYAHDTIAEMQPADAVALFASFTEPRVVVTESAKQADPLVIVSVLHGSAYGFRRAKFIPSPGGDILAMEFLRKD